MSIFDQWTQNALGISKTPTREALNAYHLSRFNLLLEYVKQHSVFYQSYPAYLSSLEEVEQLPTISAEDIGRHGNQMLCVSQSEIDRVLTVESSGTTGEAKRLFFTGEDMESTVAFFAQGFFELIEPGDVVLILFPCHREHSVGTLVGKAISRMGGKPILCGPNQTFEEMCRLIEKEQVNAIASLPTMALSLARYGLAKGLQIHMKSLLISGDYLSEFVRHELEDIWDCRVFNHYGLAESGLGLALECPYHKGMHLRERDMYVEVLDPDGKNVPDGLWGELTLTTLERRGMPLIRYRTGDRARILPEPCACGSFLKRIDRIAGRIQEEKKKLPIYDLDEQVFRFSREIVDYVARVEAEPYAFQVLSDAPEDAMAAWFKPLWPNAEIKKIPLEHAKPLCFGKRAFLHD